MVNGLDRLALDLQAAGRDLESDEPARAYSDALAGTFRTEVPVVTGYLRSTVYSDPEGVGVGAVYAGVVARNNPYDERALARTDPGDYFAAYVDDVLDDHLQPVYI